MTLVRTLFFVGAVFAVYSTGCGSSGSDGASKKAFAACCATADDCASSVCSDDQHVCTKACTADADCPPEPKSGTAKCSSKGVCEGETKDLDCEHPGGSQGTGGASAAGGTEGTAGAGGSAGSGGLVSGGASGATGSGGGGKSATGGASGGGIGIGDPCSTDAACRSGICYRPGGPPGFCTTTCSVSFDAACSGSSPGGQNASGEYLYCMPFGGSGGRCFPGCVNSPTVCSKFLGVTCTSVKDIANYGGNVCTETL